MFVISGVPGRVAGEGSDEETTSSESEDEFAKKPTPLVVPAATVSVSAGI